MSTLSGIKQNPSQALSVLGYGRQTEYPSNTSILYDYILTQGHLMVDRPEFIKFFITLATLSMLLSSHAVIASDSIFTPACDEQSGNEQPCPLELPKETIEKLIIDAGFGWGIFNGSIYNGNDEYRITQLVVSMTPIHDHHHMEMMGDMHDMPHETRIHHINMNLKPLTKGAISMALENDVVHVHDFEWKILKAFGHKIQ